MIKVIAPARDNGAPGYSGRRVGIMFDKGVGYTEALSWGQKLYLDRKGYTVEEHDTVKRAPAKATGAKKGGGAPSEDEG